MDVISKSQILKYTTLPCLLLLKWLQKGSHQGSTNLRVRLSKAKPQAKQTNTTKPNHKRAASESDSEEAEDEAEQRVKKKQNTTHRQSEESKSEVELVEDGANSSEEVESVDETHSSEVPDEQEVSKCYLFERNAH